MLSHALCSHSAGGNRPLLPQVWDAQEAEKDRRRDAQKRAIQAAAEAAAAAAAAVDPSSMPLVITAALGVDVPVQSGAEIVMPSADAFAAMTVSDLHYQKSSQPCCSCRRYICSCLLKFSFWKNEGNNASTPGQIIFNGLHHGERRALWSRMQQ